MLLQRGYGYAYSLTHNRARAEDLLQDAWVAILKANGPWKSAYMFTAIRNRFIDQYRRERLVVLDSWDHLDQRELSRHAPDLRDTEMIRAKLDTVDQALKTLRAEEREALFLAGVEGYTTQEVADLTGRPRGTVLSLIHRARQKVRRFCDDAEAEAAS